MKREILDVYYPGSCCPGHDKYPADTYKNRRSKSKRSDSIKKEHRHVRRVKRQNLKSDLLFITKEDF
ncbi:hypothetical protein Phi10_043 [Salmonella phage vB_SentM_Phi_10]|uniref:Uncharacterized protein n=3 Tax=Kuttervirus TaxID=2169536 RepID=A0A1X9I967_9CAUD|nr:hypothetical protein DET7_119 [Salmonella phage Det7]YP_009293447.1 hypothetical protein BI092_gp132 [Salmonella phage vB-SalM-PM10]ANT44573.1 hypothetical protein vB_SenM-2_115 [Salmonella phage vB_SenM-2]QFR58689.1 hypothetical protein Phi10_043 [Salmonella phage vB_SentM_Phi_10]WPJ70464.1 hypothetical protein orfRA148_00083c [Salmonella phage RA148]AJQ20938.1 hypothetical protein DET7_119 [Salmonella phage Det7]ANO57910.1 hypothetical protein [Salmonella phage vB-SalM-PM10]